MNSKILPSHASNLSQAYLHNMQIAQRNGQDEHAFALFSQALYWMNRNYSDQDVPALSLSGGIGLHTGKKRSRNQDYAFFEQVKVSVPPYGEQEARCIMIVADGVGGGQKGDEASRLAVHAFVEFVFPYLLDPEVQGPAVSHLLVEGIRRANQLVCQRNQGVVVQDQRMGTTFTAVLTVREKAYVASIGDSRAYLFRPETGLNQLTIDHSLVAQYVQIGKIRPEEVFTHPERNKIYRCLGEQNLTIDEPRVEPLHDRDVLLLCSDGLWEMVPDTEALGAVLADEDLSVEEQAERLVQLALQGGGVDNIGILVAKVSMNLAECQTLLLPDLDAHEILV